jgi:hypothetical protein
MCLAGYIPNLMLYYIASSTNTFPYGNETYRKRWYEMKVDKDELVFFAEML